MGLSTSLCDVPIVQTALSSGPINHVWSLIVEGKTLGVGQSLEHGPALQHQLRFPREETACCQDNGGPQAGASHRGRLTFRRGGPESRQYMLEQDVGEGVIQKGFSVF